MSFKLIEKRKYCMRLYLSMCWKFGLNEGLLCQPPTSTLTVLVPKVHVSYWSLTVLGTENLVLMEVCFCQPPTSKIEVVFLCVSEQRTYFHVKTALDDKCKDLELVDRQSHGSTNPPSV